MGKSKLACLVVALALSVASTGRGGSGDPLPFPPESAPGGDPNVQQAVLVTRVEAVYPPEALAQKLEDEVHVAFVVGESGEVGRVRAFFSRHDIFEAPAVAAVRQWKFKPATMHGHPITTRMVVAIRFSPPQ